jgi:hypothetical protein
MKFRKPWTNLKTDIRHNWRFICAALMIMSLIEAVRDYIQRDYYNFGLNLFIGAANALGTSIDFSDSDDI